MVTLIKTLHTAIWWVMTFSVFYIGFCVFYMEFDRLFVISMVLISVEIVIIFANSWKCPLTAVARRYTDNQAANFDIYLPEIIAKYNKEIFSGILTLILILYIYNSFK